MLKKPRHVSLNKILEYNFHQIGQLGRFNLVVAMSGCCWMSDVCPLFMYQILRPILPPLPEVGCPKFLEIQNPSGKVPMDQRPLVKGYIANFGISLDVFEFFRFGLFFLFLIFVVCFLGPPYSGIGATILIDREIRCVPYAGFFKTVFNTYVYRRVSFSTVDIIISQEEEIFGPKILITKTTIYFFV